MPGLGLIPTMPVPARMPPTRVPRAMRSSGPRWCLGWAWTSFIGRPAIGWISRIRALKHPTLAEALSCPKETQSRIATQGSLVQEQHARTNHRASRHRRGRHRVVHHALRTQAGRESALGSRRHDRQRGLLAPAHGPVRSPVAPRRSAPGARALSRSSRLWSDLFRYRFPDAPAEISAVIRWGI